MDSRIVLNRPCMSKKVMNLSFRVKEGFDNCDWAMPRADACPQLLIVRTLLSLVCRSQSQQVVMGWGHSNVRTID